MSSFNMTKVLVLLIAFIIYTNYENYMKKDTTKLHREVLSLQTNIAREINIAKQHYTKESLLLDYSKLTFDGKKYSYSQAMGEMQNQLSSSADGLCNVKRMKWAQVPSRDGWYDKLRMNVSLSCTPNNLIKLTNALKAKPTIYNVENFRVTRDRNKALLNITIQLVAFRRHN